jgi:histidinol-phosphate phosphatase family protein
MRAISLDHDGLINRSTARLSKISITRVVEFEMPPGAAEAIAEPSQHDYAIFIVTNQRGIARGLLTYSDLDKIHIKLINIVEQTGGHIRQIYVCPHDCKDHCNCRKPNPGLLLRAQQEYQVNLRVSWMVGDSASDIVAGKRAGCRRAFIGRTPVAFSADVLAPSSRDAVTKIGLFDLNDLLS